MKTKKKTIICAHMLKFFFSNIMNDLELKKHTQNHHLVSVMCWLLCVAVMCLSSESIRLQLDTFLGSGDVV